MNREEYNKAFREHVKRLTTPIFQKVLHETRNNHMSGRGSGLVAKKVVLFRPHNYRLFFDFSPLGFVPPSRNGVIEPVGGVGSGYKHIVSSIEYKAINSGKDHSFTNYYGCRIVVRKKTIELNPVKWTEKTHSIKLTTPEDINEQVEHICGELTKHCLDTLKCFVEDFGGSTSFTIINSQEELKISREEKIDLIPRRLKFHADLVKKVYDEQNVEFKDPLSAVHYLQNRAIENVAPEIATAINGLAEALQHPLTVIKSKIKCYDDLLRYKDVIANLNERDRLDLSDWISNNWGVINGSKQMV